MASGVADPLHIVDGSPACRIMGDETVMGSVRWIRGTVAHWSVYCFLPETNTALLQYYFFEVGDDDSLTPRILLMCVPIDPKGPGRESLMRSYGSIVASSLAESGEVAAAAAAATASVTSNASVTSGSSIDDEDDDDDETEDDDDDDDGDDGGRGGNGTARDGKFEDADGGGRVREIGEPASLQTNDSLNRLENRLVLRSAALARLLLYSGGPWGRVLKRVFTPVEVLVGTGPDDLEILAARPWEGAASAILHAVATFPVYRIRVPGSYRSDVPVRGGICTLASDRSETRMQDETVIRNDPWRIWRTRSHERLCRGRPNRPLAFVIRAGLKRLVFEDVFFRSGAAEDVGAAQGRPILDLFDLRDVVWKGRRLRLCIPKGFLALTFSDDQCLLLLRDAFVRLFEEAYAGFPGIYPLFDFLGPNMFRRGGSRSIFLPGFPCVPVYSAPWPHSAAGECGADVVRHQRALAGLPDVLGAVGKASVLDLPGGAVEFVSGSAVSEIDDYYVDLRNFRINARWCSPRNVSGKAVGDSDCSEAHIYVDRRGVCRVLFRGLRLAVLRCCLPGDNAAFPFVLEDLGRRTDLAAVTAFLERLRTGSPGVFRRVRAVENYLSKVITDACDKAGFAWILVRDDCEFYVRQRAGSPPPAGRLESVVRAALNKAWVVCFGPQFVCPVNPVVCSSRAGVLLAVDRFVLGGFEDPIEGYVPGWISSAGRLLAEAVYQAFDAADWSAKTAIVKIMATHILKMAARRHEPGFWVERFAPARNPVDERSLAIDASEFSGVRVTGGLIATQSSDMTLNDRIDYEGYARRTFFMLKICLRRAIRVLFAERAAEEQRQEDLGSFSAVAAAEEAVEEALNEFEDAFEDAQQDVLARYLIFFRLR